MMSLPSVAGKRAVFIPPSQHDAVDSFVTGTLYCIPVDSRGNDSLLPIPKRLDSCVEPGRYRNFFDASRTQNCVRCSILALRVWFV